MFFESFKFQWQGLRAVFCFVGIEMPEHLACILCMERKWKETAAVKVASWEFLQNSFPKGQRPGPWTRHRMHSWYKQPSPLASFAQNGSLPSWGINMNLHQGAWVVQLVVSDSWFQFSLCSQDYCFRVLWSSSASVSALTVEPAWEILSPPSSPPVHVRVRVLSLLNQSVNQSLKPFKLWPMNML